MALWDHDKASSDDMLTRTFLDLNSIIEDGGLKVRRKGKGGEKEGKGGGAGGWCWGCAEQVGIDGLASERKEDETC